MLKITIFFLSCKNDEMSLRPFWHNTVDIILRDVVMTRLNCSRSRFKVPRPRLKNYVSRPRLESRELHHDYTEFLFNNAFNTGFNPKI